MPSESLSAAHLSPTVALHSSHTAFLWMAEITAVSSREPSRLATTTTEASMTNQNMVWAISLVTDNDKSLLDSTAVS